MERRERMVDRRSLAHVALREGMFVVFGILGAVAFLNHHLLYMTGEKIVASPPSSYALSSVLFYGFLRGVFFIGTMRSPRAREDRNVCPECGQPLHERTAANPRPARTAMPGTPRIVRPIPVARPIPIAVPRKARGPAVSNSVDVVNPRADLVLLLGELVQDPDGEQYMNGEGVGPARRAEPAGPEHP